ncbi:hypothetical protein M231_00479 [Tremella mesenterica]|uniref:N-acetyltransferase domain-containing protein n=1 Tax=Tremella mesenterica TaxID=5217 RepID=A0A4Q1BVP4_TREME|nr:hypothetical protein M231_00479 [Tremella mesenterica]
MAEKEQAEGAWAKNNGDVVWVLVDRSDPHGPILSACETHRIKGFLKPQGHDQVQNAWYYALAYVITPPQYQKRGYATHLLRLLHYVLCSDPPAFPTDWGNFPTVLKDLVAEGQDPQLNEEGAPPTPMSAEVIIEKKSLRTTDFPKACGMLLSNDVSEAFYARCGLGPDGVGFIAPEEWQWELEWELGNGVDFSHWETLYESDIPPIAALLSRLSEQRVQATSSTNKAVFCPDPASEGILTFASVRGAYGPQPAWRKFPQPLGIRLPAHKGTSGEVHQDDTIILFALYNQQVGDGLLITYIHNLSPDVLPSALSALDRLISEQGAGWNMGRVWDLDSSNDLAAAWKQSGRRVNVNRRRGTGSHLLSWCFYQGKTEVLDRQLWTWL